MQIPIAAVRRRFSMHWVFPVGVTPKYRAPVIPAYPEVAPIRLVMRTKRRRNRNRRVDPAVLVTLTPTID